MPPPRRRGGDWELVATERQRSLVPAGLERSRRSRVRQRRTASAPQPVARGGLGQRVLEDAGAEVFDVI